MEKKLKKLILDNVATETQRRKQKRKSIVEKVVTENVK